MIIRKLRLDRGWSQNQLAEIASLSVRTIQRVERGGSASLDTMGALASALDIPISEIAEKSSMYQPNELDARESEALLYVRDIQGFYHHAIGFGLTHVVLLVANLIMTPDYFWVLWSILGWGMGLATHAFCVFERFNVFGPDWEKRQVERRLATISRAEESS